MQHQKVREEAVQEAIKNSNRYRNFAAGSFNKYVSNLAADRERADNDAMQATSSAFSISTEILSDSERIPSYTILPFDVDSVTSPQPVVVGCIGNTYYVSTEFHEPFPPAMWGGSIAGSSREFCKHESNRWPIKMVRVFYGSCQKFQPLYPRKASHYAKNIRSISSW